MVVADLCCPGGPGLAWPAKKWGVGVGLPLKRFHELGLISPSSASLPQVGVTQ